MGKTVLILANKDGGLFVFRRELLQKLIADGHRVIAAVPAGERTADLQALGCECLDVKLSRRGTNPIEDFKLLQQYKRIIRREAPDIVFTYTIKPNIYGGLACQALKVPYVVNVTGLGSAVENPGPLQKLTVLLYKWGIKKAKKVFFQNGANQQFMVSHRMVNGRYDLLPGSGVNLSRYIAEPYPETDTVDFVFVARVMREKGIDQYLEAAKYIREKYPFTRFHICGACQEEYKEQLENLQQQEVIIYHGLVRDMPAMYRQTHCTVHPSFYPEGMSNVLLESCATARPVITTDRAGCREAVDDGVNGFLVKQRDAEDLIQKIERFLALSHQEKEQMGLAGRAKMEREFDRQIVVNKYLEEL